MKLTTVCPAKVNTFLTVGPPDARGYHPLRTYFHAIDWCDTLTVEPASAPEIVCNWPDLPAENTLTKTLRLVGELYPIPPLRVTLHKEIPSQAGLGGGSSDAAGLIRLLAHLLALPLSEFFFDVASSVGADVPFFLVGGAARGEGYGERLTPLDQTGTEAVLVVFPPVGTPTAAAYAALDETERGFKEFPSDPFELYNDFERVQPCLCGELQERLQVHGARAAGLSGSGSASFGLFADLQRAERAKASIEEEFPDVHARVCRFLKRAESLAVQVG